MARGIYNSAAYYFIAFYFIYYAYIYVFFFFCGILVLNNMICLVEKLRALEAFSVLWVTFFNVPLEGKNERAN
jgi:hypothetical protein